MPSCYTSFILLGRFLPLESFSLQCSELTIWSLQLVSKQLMKYLLHALCKRRAYVFKERLNLYFFPNLNVISDCFEDGYHPAAGAEDTLSADLNHSSCKLSRNFVPSKFHFNQLKAFTWRLSFYSNFPLFIRRETIKGQQSIRHLMGEAEKNGELTADAWFWIGSAHSLINSEKREKFLYFKVKFIWDYSIKWTA